MNEEVAMQFVVVAEHAPESCPTSNKQIRELMREGAQQIPDLAQKLGVSILTLRVLGPDHQIIAVVEAADIEAVRDFLMQSRLVQWNTTTVKATWSLEEALTRAEALPTLA
jgi:uncharacterized protein with GYD domain